jgi:hypothetical protein
LFPDVLTRYQDWLTATSHHERTRLLDIYVARVDSVYRIWHWPATISIINEEEGSGLQSAAATALKHAIYFMGVCTLTPDECFAMFQCEKSDLIVAYRGIAEHSLARTGLLTTPNVNSLHAFVIYLVS